MNSSHVNSSFQEPYHAFFWRAVNFISFLENWKMKQPTVPVSAINTYFSYSLRLFDSSLSHSLGSIKHLKSVFVLFCFASLAINSKTKMSYTMELSLLWVSERELFVLFILESEVNSRMMDSVRLTAPKTEILHSFQGLAGQWLQFLLQFAL